LAITNLIYKDGVSGKNIDKVNIVEHHEIVRQNISTFLGTLKNNSEENVRGFKLKVDLFDLNGTFVEQCDKYISMLASKKETNFKIVCKKCDDNKTVEHNTYKIYINSY